MWLLALDTSGKTGSIALLKDGELLKELTWLPKDSHTSELPSQIEKILSSSSLSLEKIDAYALTIGPGSFTGLRVALSFVKGLVCLSEKPVLGVSTLEVLAASVEGQEWICPLLDARQNEIYGACYEQKQKSLKLVVGESAYNPEDFLKALQSQKIKTPISFLGAGARVYEKLIRNFFADQAVFLDSSLDTPQASKVGQLAFRQFQEGHFSKGAIDLFPNYLRVSVAQKKKIKNIE